jgi:ATPase subunit of ABC transporter with duplicated ATPase domains
MDEPTNHLDMPAREALETTLAGFKGSVIAISHDRYFLNRCVTRILAIESGKIVSYEGNYDFYRSVNVKLEEAITEPAPKSASRNPSAIPKVKPGQPAKQKKIQSQNRVDPAIIETQIESLEKQIREMEATFNRDTPYQAYREYDALVAQVGLLYEDWNQLFKEK